MNFLSLFTGIGGLDLGLQRAGMTPVGQVEIDPFCQRVLARHWPEVPRHDDARTAATWWRNRPRPAVDVLAGGFPCQPFSTAGHRRGVADDRWGWPWMLRVVDAVRPRYLLVENVAALLGDLAAFSSILDSLSDRGFAVEWSVVSACALGAPHARRRLFLVAYPDRVDGQPGLGAGQGRPLQPVHRETSPWPHPVNGLLEANSRTSRVADGLPRGLDSARITGLGNAVVPQVAERIGHLIRGDQQHTRDLNDARAEAA